MTYSKAISSFGSVGFAIAFVLHVAFTLGQLLGLVQGMGDQIWVWVLWPTAIMMMGAEGSGRFAGLAGFLIGTFSNAIVYAVMGAALVFVRRRFFHSPGADRTA